MKKSIFIILPLILWAFAACDNDDSEWDSGNLGVNSVEGTWQRVGAYPKVLAIFLTLMLMGNWILTEMSNFMIRLWSSFDLYTR